MVKVKIVTMLAFLCVFLPFQSDALAYSKKDLKTLMETRNCAGCDFSEAHLEGVDLSNANLEGVNFSDAHLEGANLSNSNLSKADFTHAEIDKANLENANLEGAFLYRCDLDGSNLRGANLKGAFLLRAESLGNAKFKNAILDGVIWEKGEKCKTDSLGICKR